MLSWIPRRAFRRSFEPLDELLSPMKVFVSPFDNQQNHYLRNFRRQLVEAGFPVAAADELWSLKHLWPSGEPKYLFLNWFEDLLIRRHKRPLGVRWTIAIYKLFAAKLQRTKIVWVRHNYRPHAQVAPDWSLQLAYKMMSLLSSHVVVHSEAYATDSGSDYIPHPLYLPCDEDVDPEFLAQLDDASRRIAVLGQLRPSKGLDTMLKDWPSSVPVLMAGQPSDEKFKNELQQIAAQRSLDVRFVFNRLSTAQFDAALRRCRAVYIANPSHTMIVSGVFFHAASLGTPVLMRASAFAHEMSLKCSFAIEICDLSQIESALRNTTFSTREAIVAEANEFFGKGVFHKQISRLIS